MKKFLFFLLILSIVSITFEGCMKAEIRRWDNGYDRPHIEEEKEAEKEFIVNKAN